MSDVNRYKIYPAQGGGVDIDLNASGEWVKFEDFNALASRLDRPMTTESFEKFFAGLDGLDNYAIAELWYRDLLTLGAFVRDNGPRVPLDTVRGVLADESTP